MRTILFALAAAVSCGTLSAEEGVTPETLSVTFAAKYRAASVLRYDYTSTMRAVVDGARLYRDLRIFIGPWSTTSSTVVADNEGRLYVSRVNEWSRLEPMFLRELAAEFQEAVSRPKRFGYPFERVCSVASRVWEGRDELDQASRRAPSVTVFDGTKLWQHDAGETLETEGVARKAFISIDPQRLHGPFFDRTVFDCMLLAFPTSLVSDHGIRLSNQLPELIRDGQFRIAQETDPVDGADCIVVENLDTQKIWLDPAVGFAVRKRVWMERGVPWFEFVGNDFTEVMSQLWLPKQFSFIQYGVPGTLAGDFDGRPIFREDCTATQLKCNDDSDRSVFTIEIGGGSFVIDETLAPSKDSRITEKQESGNGRINPSLSYVQPANKADLEKVINDARAASDKPTSDNGFDGASTNTRWRLIVMLNVALVGALAGAIAVRRYLASKR